MQIAQALEAAHEKGIVHRDLKPANIKIRADGTVKVWTSASQRHLVRTVRDPRRRWPSTIRRRAPPIGRATGLGAIVGTSAYMAPEQARAAVDKRADIWAFGVVLGR